MNKTITITDETLEDFVDFFHQRIPSGSTRKYAAVFGMWLQQQKSTEPVGLSESQIRSLADRFAVMFEFDPEQFIKQFEEWKLSQQFLEPVVKHISISKKPDWKHAPSWANWLAKNLSGEWVWFEFKPELCFGAISTKWAVPNNSKIVSAEDNSDWQQSLEARPTVISKVYDADNERLKDNKKAITIHVDWSKAPNGCDTYEVIGSFKNSKWSGGGNPMFMGETLYSETKPVEKPIVAMGQEWQQLSIGGEKVSIFAVIRLPGSTRLDCGWVENAELVVYRPLKKFTTEQDNCRMLLSDFIKDFARIK